MAQYKVPQDVEADDKLIGPFSFRQFVYLLIAAGLIAIAVGLFQLFPLLAIIPLPPVLLLLALALPLKKDQPMETYLAAIVSFYLKPRKRLWTPGQKESTILITAPKIVEDTRTRNLSQEEATHRLSFLADIVDSEGHSIKGSVSNVMRDDLMAEAAQAKDIFDNTNYQSQLINQAISQDRSERHQEAIKEMREAIERNETFQPIAEAGGAPAIIGSRGEIKGKTEEKTENKSMEKSEPKEEPKSEPEEKASVIVQPGLPDTPKEKATEVEKKGVPKAVKPDIIELANNSEYTIATIAKEANRINRKDEGEVFISLH